MDAARPTIARLAAVDLRAAWSHEALEFTPWLYENLDQIGEVLGIQLEPEGAEVAVESFSADILARDASDGSLVLIENQLEGSDHMHLGQIMTYLAGLEAKTIVWIARDFREPHRSAIRWLNEYTDPQFRFFAIQLRVVRIANSPFAPLFDVVERPNDWERRLHAASGSRARSTELGEQRAAFWEAYVLRVPDEAEHGPVDKRSNRWHVLKDLGLIVSVYVYTKGVGIYVRGPFQCDHDEVRASLEPHAGELERRLGVEIGTRPDHFFGCWRLGDYKDPEQQPELIDWLAQRAAAYESALREIITEVK